MAMDVILCYLRMYTCRRKNTERTKETLNHKYSF